LIISKRRLNKQVIADFRLGYSPTGSGYLPRSPSAKLQTNCATPAVATVSRQPICSRPHDGTAYGCTEAVIGFTARLIADEPNAPKYITRRKPAVRQSRHVFGLHLAKDAIRLQIMHCGRQYGRYCHPKRHKNVVATAIPP
jgi:hypothetical protein